jgi:hypothetical protein
MSREKNDKKLLYLQFFLKNDEYGEITIRNY